jgi:hypothetical protein
MKGKEKTEVSKQGIKCVRKQTVLTVLKTFIAKIFRNDRQTE